MSVIGTAGIRVQIIDQPNVDASGQVMRNNKGHDGAIDSSSSIENTVANAGAQRVSGTSVLSSSEAQNGQAPEVATPDLHSPSSNTSSPSSQTVSKAVTQQATKAAIAHMLEEKAQTQLQTVPHPVPPQDGPHINADGQVTGTLINVKA